MQLINFVNVSGSEKDDRCWFSWAVTFKWKRISPFRLTLQNPSFKGISKKNKCSYSGCDKKRNHYKAHKKTNTFSPRRLCVIWEPEMITVQKVVHVPIINSFANCWSLRNCNHFLERHYVIVIVVLRVITVLLRTQSNDYWSYYADYTVRNEGS